MHRYFKFSQFLKERYGEKVWKVPVDAGFSCPNRDAHTGSGGCIYCRLDSFSKMQSWQDVSVEQQIAEGIRLGREKKGINKFIIYFQASTNTFAPIDVLRSYFTQAITFPGVVGLSISTRPDCLPGAVLDLIAELTHRVDVWVELGLQSIHDRTLKLLNRGHLYQDYLIAVEKLKSLPARICTHVMLGLPGEGHADLMATADEIARSGIHEVKLHPLLVLKDTTLADMFGCGKVRALALDEYVSHACDFLERLPASMVIQRLTAEAPQDLLLAPPWAMNKSMVLRGIEEKLIRRDSGQGERFSPGEKLA
jgi:radical SAM protein (TIGR01212 family)